MNHSFQYINRIAHVMRWIMFSAFASVSDMVLAADTPATNTVDLNGVRSYVDGAIANDLATDIMTKLFGSIFTNPLTSVGETSGLFGQVFLAFNVVVFGAGVAWATYGVLSGVVQSAHEGIVLGKRMSAIWMPIRMVTGIGSLVPAFGGFSLSQVVMILAAGWGITFGNYAYLKALEAAQNFTPLLSMSIGYVGSQIDAMALTRAIFEQELCRLDANQFRAESAVHGVSVSVNENIISTPYTTVVHATKGIGYAYGTPRDPTKCGAVGIKQNTGAARSESSWFGFRNSAVEYTAISDGVYSKYESAYSRLDPVVRQIAFDWAQRIFMASHSSDDRQIPIPEDRLHAAAQAFASPGSGNNDANTANNRRGGALKSAAFENMKQYGFMGAGAFYSTFAELNTSIGTAARSVEMVIVAPTQRSIDNESRTSSATSRYREAYAGMQQTKTSAGQTTIVGGSCGQSSYFYWEFLSGECSIGQAFVSLALSGMTNGSSVGASNTQGGMQIIDPIIASKNIGDYMMLMGETILAATVGGGKDEDESMIEKGAGAVGGVVTKAVKWLMPDFIKNMGRAFVAMLPTIGGLLFGIGALLSLYIPMVPFIHWVSAIVQYAATVVEAMAAAPLWAFAHLQPDGEGMGQRSERGYLYLLLLMFTPILMVISFFAACGLVVLLGSAVMMLFFPAMANAQGNSVTGIFSVIGYIFIFFMLMNIIIQGLFNLTMDLKDDVLGWVGNVGKSTIGRDTEGKAHNMFIMGGSFGRNAAIGSVQAMNQPPKPKTSN